MKKILLLLVMSIGITLIAGAQHIELIGMGIMDETNTNPDPTLHFSDVATIDKVVVEAAAVFRAISPFNDDDPKSIRFYETNDGAEDVTVDFNLAEQDLAPGIPNGGDQKWGYYTATFNDVDDGGISLDNMGQGANVVSFIAYVYRTGGSGVYSEAKGDHAFMFLNGSTSPMIYDFTLPFSDAPRDIVITVPFSEVNQDGRYSIIDITAGAYPPVHVEFDDNNEGERLHIETITLNDVPGDITEVSVSIYSPNPTNGVDTKNGDSFISSAVLLTTTFDQGCTLTQGYWKTHADPNKPKKYDPTWDLLGGPLTEFFDTEMSYLKVFNTSPGGNAYYILAHQYIAAELNQLAGASLNGKADDAFDAATIFFNTYSPDDVGKGKNANKELQKVCTDLGEILDNYNKGEIGPGHCDDGEEVDEKSGIATSDNDLEMNEFTVFPNPVQSTATIMFKPKYDGKATIDLYNSLGQKTTRLMDRNVQKDIPETFMFNGQQFEDGLYIMVIQNGAFMKSTKIQISK